MKKQSLTADDSWMSEIQNWDRLTWQHAKNQDARYGRESWNRPGLTLLAENAKAIFELAP